MPTLRAPLLSLEATGDVAHTLTYQHYGSQHTVRAHRPAHNPHSLPQTYRRWLFQDYIAYWKTLPPATKLSYINQARTQNTTAVALWLRDNLQPQPDLNAAWHMDIISANSTPSSSPTRLPLTLNAVTLTPGPIASALLFNGTTSYATHPHHTALNMTSAWSITTYLSAPFTGPHPLYETVIAKGLDDWTVYLYKNPNRWTFGWYDTSGVWHRVFTLTPISPNALYPLAATYDGAATRIYLDGHLDNATPDTGTPRTPTSAFYMGQRVDGQYLYPGLMDETRLYGRVLTETEVSQHADRRWPI